MTGPLPSPSFPTQCHPATSFPSSSLTYPAALSARCASNQGHGSATQDLFDEMDASPGLVSEDGHEYNERVEKLATSDTVYDAASLHTGMPRYQPKPEKEDDWYKEPADKRFYLEVCRKTDIDEIEKIYADVVRDSDQRQAIRNVIARIKDTGTYRRLATCPFAWRMQLDRLQNEFPNAAEYVEYLRGMMALAAEEERPLSCDPAVLVGNPGVGKSLIAQRVAEMIGGTDTVTIRFENSQSSAELAGSSEFWSNSKPGRIFEKLVYGESASPVIVCEELEKTSVDRFDPLSSLLSLLEKDSAAEFRDQSAPWLRLDARYIIFIAVVNSLESLPSPLRSRLTTFYIPDLTPEQTHNIIRALWDTLCSEYPQASSGITLTDEAIEALAQQSPRIIKKVLRRALGRALFNQQNQIGMRDIEACMERKPIARRFGFI